MKIGEETLTQEYLKSVLHYDDISGNFYWKPRKEINRFIIAWNAKHVNVKAGTQTKVGYIRITLTDANNTKKPRLAHRLAFLYMRGYVPKYIDHINGNKSDNSFKNLREASSEINNQNISKAHVDNSTKLLGVAKARNKFASFICANGTRKYLGIFKSAEEAHEVYLKAKRNLHQGNML